MYFYLKNDSYLVKGARGGAVYNLENGSVHAIDPIAVKLIEACERGEKISKASKGLSCIGFSDALSYLNRLDKERLGNFYAGPKEVEKDSRYSSSNDLLDAICLGLLEDCNQKCLHCRSRQDSIVSSGEKLSLDEWRKVIEDASELGCKAILFIGGEPLLESENLFSIVRRAKDLGYQEIVLFSNLSVLKEKWVELFAELGISVNASIYSKSPEIHDRITQMRGSLNKLLNNSKKLEKRGVKIHYRVVIMKQNQDEEDEIIKFLRNLGIAEYQYEILKSLGTLINSEYDRDQSKSKYQDINTRFSSVSKRTFLRRFNGNSCWRGKVYVTSNGEVSPCIMYRKETCGNVRSLPLKDIVEGEKLQRFWKLSLDQVEVCKDCEYRYACHDCQPVCFDPKGNNFSRKPWCKFDPYEERYSAPLSFLESQYRQKFACAG